jgi:prevent-host-death family protein
MLNVLLEPSHLGGEIGGALACRIICDYRDHMTTTLREAKARLSEMVKLASRGEEVVITVHGKEMAKLVPVPKRPKKLDKKKWLAELDALRRKYSTGKVGMTAQEIQDWDREDRV